MQRRKHMDFGEYALAAPVPVFGTWPQARAEHSRLTDPITWIAVAGLLLGLAIGFILAWPTKTLVYPGTQVAAWMGAPDKVLQGTSGQPVKLQNSGQVQTVSTLSKYQHALNTQLTNFSWGQPGYMDQVSGRYLQGTQNIPAK